MTYLTEYLAKLFRSQEKSNTGEIEILPDEAIEISAQTLLAVKQVYERSIFLRAEAYNRELVDTMIFVLDKQSRVSYNILTLRSYYKAELPFECLKAWVLTYSSFAYFRDNLLEDLLPFIKAAIDKNDGPLFGEIVSALNNRIHYESGKKHMVAYC